MNDTHSASGARTKLSSSLEIFFNVVWVRIIFMSALAAYFVNTVYVLAMFNNLSHTIASAVSIVHAPNAWTQWPAEFCGSAGATGWVMELCAAMHGTLGCEVNESCRLNHDQNRYGQNDLYDAHLPLLKPCTGNAGPAIIDTFPLFPCSNPTPDRSLIIQIIVTEFVCQIFLFRSDCKTFKEDKKYDQREYKPYGTLQNGNSAKQ
jgi:hypothetical protein